jgi:hypothetical protein
MLYARRLLRLLIGKVKAAPATFHLLSFAEHFLFAEHVPCQTASNMIRCRRSIQRVSTRFRIAQKAAGKLRLLTSKVRALREFCFNNPVAVKVCVKPL